MLAVSTTPPPPTPSGRARRATARHVQPVSADTGRRLLDLTVRLVGPRAHHVPANAVTPGRGVTDIHATLASRPLIAWTTTELHELCDLAAHPDLARPARSYPSLHERDHHGYAVSTLCTRWRGQLDRDGTLIPCLHPGNADRLRLMLDRIAADTIAA